MEDKPTSAIADAASVAIHNACVTAGRMKASILSAVAAADPAARSTSRPATTMTWSNTTFQTMMAQAIQRARATAALFHWRRGPGASVRSITVVRLSHADPEVQGEQHEQRNDDDRHQEGARPESRRTARQR